MPKSFALTENERRFIAGASLCADASTKELSSTLGMPQHTVRYVRDSLLERDIVRPLFQLNYFALGLNDFGIYLNRGSENSAARKKFEALMVKFPSVFWVVKASGAYQYALSFVSPRAHDLDDLFTAIRPMESGAHFGKSFGLRLNWAIYPPCYLVGETKQRSCIFTSAKDPVHSLDDIDSKLLSLMSSNPTNNSNEIARAAGMSASSVAYRITQLRKKGIISNLRYMLNCSKLGFNVTRLLIVDRGMTSDQHKEFSLLCARHPNVVAALRCTGDWDYELRLEAETPDVTDSFCQLLFDAFGNGIGDISTVHQLQYLKHVAFPW